MRKNQAIELTARHRPKSVEEPRVANPFAVAAIRFLALTGWRMSEALTLKWEFIDAERGIAILPESKTGRSVRPLGAPAIELLGSLPRLADSDYVFPSASQPGAPLATLARLWRAVLEDAGLAGVRLHDLRHTAAAFAASAGGSLVVIATTLGHRNTSTTAR
jgi:integrase